MERPQTKYVDVGGAEVAYQVVGEGPPDVIDVPGFSHVDLLWDDPIAAPFPERLASFGRLILMNRRGTGASDAIADTAMPTWEEWADDVGAVLDAGRGEVLVSSTVKDLIVGSAIKLEDRGEHELKGVPGSRRLCGAVS